MTPKIFVDYFANKYKQKFGNVYPVSWAKHCKIMSRLMGMYNIEDIYRFIDCYLNDPNPFLGQSGNKLELLVSQIPIYISNRNTKQKPSSKDFELLYDNTS